VTDIFQAALPFAQLNLNASGKCWVVVHMVSIEAVYTDMFAKRVWSRKHATVIKCLHAIEEVSVGKPNHFALDAQLLCKLTKINILCTCECLCVFQINQQQSCEWKRVYSTYKQKGRQVAINLPSSFICFVICVKYKL